MNRSCPLCGQIQGKVLFHPRESPGLVSQCLNCGMVYISTIKDDRALIFEGPIVSHHTDPKIITSSDINDIKATWEYNFLPSKEAEAPVLRQNATDALKRIASFLDPPISEGKILDFGSGWGFFLDVAKGHGWHAFGLEPTPACAVYARAKFGVTIVTDTLRENTFPEDFFDAISSFQVFEHLPHPDQDLRILYKMLRHNGIILIEVPNYDTWTMRLMKSRHRHFVQDHLNFFSKDTLSQFLTRQGFRILDSYYPKRRMSIRHLVSFWLPKYLPTSVNNILRRLIQSLGLWEATIGINLGDIVTVIAAKR